MPDYDIVTRYKELGGEIITLGSDSHTAETIAHSFDAVKEKLQDLGFKYTAYFENREPKFVKLKQNTRTTNQQTHIEKHGNPK